MSDCKRKVCVKFDRHETKLNSIDIIQRRFSIPHLIETRLAISVLQRTNGHVLTSKERTQLQIQSYLNGVTFVSVHVLDNCADFFRFWLPNSRWISTLFVLQPSFVARHRKRPFSSYAIFCILYLGFIFCPLPERDSFITESRQRPGYSVTGTMLRATIKETLRVCINIFSVSIPCI
jgi:hypothetical protein